MIYIRMKEGRMSKQTAIQELIDEMESLLEQPYVNPQNALNDCIHLAWAKLEKEKEQIIDAHCDGQDIKDTAGVPDDENYYNQTYRGTNENP